MTDLERALSDLERAKSLIARLRAENQVLKDEKRRFVVTVSGCRHHIGIAGNATRKWVIGIVLAQLEKARLL